MLFRAVTTVSTYSDGSKGCLERNEADWLRDKDLWPGQSCTSRLHGCH